MFIYLDNHATTRIDPRVLEAMLPYYDALYGNAASSHALGRMSREAVEGARSQILEAAGCHDGRVVLTSGATEANNLILFGLLGQQQGVGRHVIVSSIEHPSVSESAAELVRRGCRVTVLPVDRDGFVSAESVEAAIDDDTVLVSIQYANQEIGTVQNTREIGSVCRRNGVLFHSDATQALGKVAINADDMGVDAMSFSAHKCHGPKGIGALVLSSHVRSLRLSPILHGGGQEWGFRSGTVNVPLAVGFGVAASIASSELPEVADHCRQLRDDLWRHLSGSISGIEVNGPDPIRSADRRLPNNLNVAMPGLEADLLVASLENICISSGSACSSASIKPSVVVSALPGRRSLAASSIRFGVSRFTTPEEIEAASSRIADVVPRIRA